MRSRFAIYLIAGLSSHLLATPPEAHSQDDAQSNSLTVAEFIDCLFELHQSLKINLTEVTHMESEPSLTPEKATQEILRIHSKLTEKGLIRKRDAQSALEAIQKPKKLTQIQTSPYSTAIRNIEATLTCKICLGLAKNTSATNCCESLYCKECIQMIIPGKCPTCRTHLEENDLNTATWIERIHPDFEVLMDFFNTPKHCE